MLKFTIRKKQKKVKRGEVSVEIAKPQGPMSSEWIWNLRLISMHQKWNHLCVWILIRSGIAHAKTKSTNCYVKTVMLKLLCLVDFF